MSKGPFKMMVKTGEVKIDQTAEIDGIYVKTGERPRSICAPQG